MSEHRDIESVANKLDPTSAGATPTSEQMADKYCDAMLDNLRKSAASPSAPEPTPEQIAQMFHETYERLAPEFGYMTRIVSAVPWDKVPESNRQLMIATCAEVKEALVSSSETEHKLNHALERVITAEDVQNARAEAAEARLAIAIKTVEEWSDIRHFVTHREVRALLVQLKKDK